MLILPKASPLIKIRYARWTVALIKEVINWKVLKAIVDTVLVAAWGRKDLL